MKSVKDAQVVAAAFEEQMVCGFATFWLTLTQLSNTILEQTIPHWAPLFRTDGDLDKAAIMQEVIDHPHRSLLPSIHQKVLKVVKDVEAIPALDFAKHCDAFDGEWTILKEKLGEARIATAVASGWLGSQHRGS